MVVHG